ncbi:class I SAM-dependent methyltransferase [Kordiimonas sp.]|uniref:class I SAM-dependent methyltransferase n=1 Tax=Kordiimonas sp. TaxID=1970157 RepID=UPI003A915CBE
MGNICRFCGEKDLKLLRSFEDYPIFIGCSDQPLEADELYRFSIHYCPSCEIIQQLNTPPLDILYRENRAFGLGKVWQGHYDQYYKFMADKLLTAKDVLEVGGGNGVLLEKILTSGTSAHIFDVEPNPQYSFDDVCTLEEYFDNNFNFDGQFDVIYSSHLIEHLLNVNEFLQNCKKFLKPTGSVFIACPDISKSFEHLHLNAFTTDHFNYYAPWTMATLAAKHGLVVVRYEGYRDHSMYLELRHAEDQTDTVIFGGKDILAIFHEYEDTIKGFASYVANLKLRSVLLFGAHAFSITFLYYLREASGEEMPLVEAVLDNEPTKSNRRLSGTNLICRTPSDILPGKDAARVLMYMGAYTEEICSQLLTLNSTVDLMRIDQFANASREEAM